jgi:hypothetical protein
MSQRNHFFSVIIHLGIFDERIDDSISEHKSFLSMTTLLGTFDKILDA